MLVLSRLRSQTIMIGTEIEIEVVDIRGDKVRLGIRAPTRVAVHRKEVYEQIMAEKREGGQPMSGVVEILPGLPRTRRNPDAPMPRNPRRRAG